MNVRRYLRRSAVVAAFTLLLVGCGLEANVPPQTETGPSQEPTAGPIPTFRPTTETAPEGMNLGPTGVLAKFIGTYPFDIVDGESFIENALVVHAVTEAVSDEQVRSTVLSPGVAGTIEVRNGSLVSWACTPHMCNIHNWTIIIDAAGSRADVCYYEDAMGQQARWYRQGVRPEMRRWVEDEGCPHA